MRIDFIPLEIGLKINNYFKDNRRSIKTKCFLCDSEFDKLLRIKQQDLPEYDIMEVDSTISENYSHFVYKVLEPDIGTELGMFHVIQTNTELYLYCGEKSDFFNNTLHHIFRRFYPHVVPTFIHSDEIYEILNNFEKIKNVHLIVKKVVRKRIFGSEPTTGIIFETYKKDRIYHGFKEAYNEARKNDVWVDRIKVSGIQPDTEIEFSFSISRNGEVSVEKGTTDVIFTTILSPMIEFSKERMEQFRGRSRRDQPNKKPKPLLVNFGKNIFDSLETRKEFVNILEKYANCNYSVVHSGNPHVYLSVVDRIDNSSFSVRTWGTESLLLVPQIKTTAVALMRFSDFLISNFHEGVIQNYQT